MSRRRPFSRGHSPVSDPGARVAFDLGIATVTGARGAAHGKEH